MIKAGLMGRGLASLFAFVAIVACTATPGAAQTSVLARMVVLPPAVTGSGVRPVEFGTVMPGAPVARTISSLADSTATGISLFSFAGITGARDAQLVFTWANLTEPISGMAIPLSLNGSYGMHCFDRKTQPAVCTLFNPGSAGGTSGTIVATPPAPPGGNSGNLRVYLGGALNPPTSLAPGLYTATISVTLTRL